MYLKISLFRLFFLFGSASAQLLVKLKAAEKAKNEAELILKPRRSAGKAVYTVHCTLYTVYTVEEPGKYLQIAWIQKLDTRFPPVLTSDND